MTRRQLAAWKTEQLLNEYPNIRSHHLTQLIDTVQELVRDVLFTFSTQRIEVAKNPGIEVVPNDTLAAAPHIAVATMDNKQVSIAIELQQAAAMENRGDSDDVVRTEVKQENGLQTQQENEVRQEDQAQNQQTQNIPENQIKQENETQNQQENQVQDQQNQSENQVQTQHPKMTEEEGLRKRIAKLSQQSYKFKVKCMQFRSENEELRQVLQQERQRAKVEKERCELSISAKESQIAKMMLLLEKILEREQ